MAVRIGLRRTLPLMLILTFFVLPSQSTRILKTFLCDPFRFDDIQGTSKRYLQDDRKLSCDSPEYDRLQVQTYAILAVWPIGVPLLYSVLLAWSRKELLAGKRTHSTRAIGFLHVDYGT